MSPPSSSAASTSTATTRDGFTTCTRTVRGEARREGGGTDKPHATRRHLKLRPEERGDRARHARVQRIDVDQRQHSLHASDAVAERRGSHRPRRRVKCRQVPASRCSSGTRRVPPRREGGVDDSRDGYITDSSKSDADPRAQAQEPSHPGLQKRGEKQVSAATSLSWTVARSTPLTTVACECIGFTRCLCLWTRRWPRTLPSPPPPP
jgi:hypothetical protein